MGPGDACEGVVMLRALTIVGFVAVATVAGLVMYRRTGKRR
jgi:hypothetical protein